MTRRALFGKLFLTGLLTILGACGGGKSDEPAPADGPPTAAILDPGPVSVGTRVMLDGSGSSDPEGASLAYVWAFLAVPPGSEARLSDDTRAEASFTPDLAGEYRVQLAVSDPAGQLATRIVTLEAAPPNGAPLIASFTSSAAQVAPGTSVRFDWALRDPDGDAVGCSVDALGNGEPIVIDDCVAVRSTTYTYTTTGSYQARLTATDARHNAAQALLSEEVTGALALSLFQPLADAVVHQKFFVIVGLQSTREIRSVVARIGERSVLLAYAPNALCGRFGCEGGFTGQLDLAGLPKGAYTLEVIARDIQNSEAHAFRTVNYDQAPTLTIAGPLPESVALPSIAVEASCSDDDARGCTLTVQNGNTLLASGTGSVSQTVDLSSQIGQAVTLSFTATDSRNQTTQASRVVYVEDPEKLSPLSRFDGPILDVEAERVLYKTSDDTLGDALYLFDRHDNRTTSVPLPAGRQVVSDARLSHYGALIVLGRQLFDWNRGTLQDLSELDSQVSLRVSGNYAIWNNTEIGATGQFDRNLYRRDLAARSTLTLSNAAGNWYNDVAPNGAVAWWSSSDYQIFFHDGSTTQITHNALSQVYVRTDGHSVVYRQSRPGTSPSVPATMAIVLFDGSAETFLRAPNPVGEPFPGRDYQLRDGWVAYTDIGNLGQTQVWTYDPLGTRRQRTFLGAPSQIDTLGDNGSLMLIAGNRRYLSTGTGALRDVSSSLGKSYEIDQRWYVALGREWFAVKER